ncbi:hypothetical protein Tco_1176818 [Tanacetum coccineum]
MSTMREECERKDDTMVSIDLLFIGKPVPDPPDMADLFERDLTSIWKDHEMTFLKSQIVNDVMDEIVWEIRISKSDFGLEHSLGLLCFEWCRRIPLEGITMVIEVVIGQATVGAIEAGAFNMCDTAQTRLSHLMFYYMHRVFLFWVDGGLSRRIKKLYEIDEPGGKRASLQELHDAGSFYKGVAKVLKDPPMGYYLLFKAAKRIVYIANCLKLKKYDFKAVKGLKINIVDKISQIKGTEKAMGTTCNLGCSFVWMVFCESDEIIHSKFPSSDCLDGFSHPEEVQGPSFLASLQHLFETAMNGFDMPLPVAVCSGLVNPLAPRKGKFHGGLITISTLCT